LETQTRFEAVHVISTWTQKDRIILEAGYAAEQDRI